MQRVDVVVVTYNSRDHIRDCVGDLSADASLNVIVVDNASIDETPELVSDLPLTLIRNSENLGFASGCNRGWREGRAQYVLFLNPDARIASCDVLALADVLEAEPSAGAVGPRIHERDGTLQVSQRAFPTLAATFGHAFFLHRVFPRTRLSFDITTPKAYATVGHPDWISGSCLLTQRPLLEALGGFDEGFFMYCEDMDLCQRIRDTGYTIRYEPAVQITHVGAASAPRARMVATMTRSRLLYAAKHRSRVGYSVERLAIALDGLIHTVLTTQGPEARRGYMWSLKMAIVGPR